MPPNSTRRSTWCPLDDRSRRDSVGDNAHALGTLDGHRCARRAARQRAGQHEMALLVEQAIADEAAPRRAGRNRNRQDARLPRPGDHVGIARVVVATATKALQDQLATKDLPFLAEHLGVDFDWADPQGPQQLRLPAAPARDGEPRSGPARTRHDGRRHEGRDQEARRLGRHERRPATRPNSTGHRPTTPGGRSASAATSARAPNVVRSASRVSPSRPGAGPQAADVVVVNTYLYGLNVASDNAILPDHDVVVFDEAHVLEDIMSDTVGVEISPGRFVALSAHDPPDPRRPDLTGSVAEIGERLRDALSPHVGERLTTPLPDSVQEPLAAARLTLGNANDAARGDRHDERGCQAAQAARPDDDRPIDPAARHRDRGPRGLRGVRVRLARLAAPRGRAARRRPDDGRGRVEAAHRDPHERHDPVVAGRLASGSRPTRSTSPMSAARSTTSRTRCSTARSTCRTRTPPSSAPRRTTNSKR